MFLGVGTDGEREQEAQACLTDLAGSSALADVRELGGMELGDSRRARRLLGYLADESRPPARSSPLWPEASRRAPGVLHRWLALKPQTPEELERQAEDTRLPRYPELRALLLERCRSAPRVACLLAALAVLPRMNDEAVWRPLSRVLLADLGPETVSRLQADGILEAVDGADGVPSYGHDTRHDAARRLWLGDDEPVLRPIARNESRRLVPALAEHVTDLGPDSAVFAAALAAVRDQQADLRLKGGPLLLCEYAASSVLVVDRLSTSIFSAPGPPRRSTTTRARRPSSPWRSPRSSTWPAARATGPAATSCSKTCAG